MKPGRNDPCPCGSGKKFKKCCAEKFEVRSPARSVPAKGTAPTPAEINQLITLFNAGRHVELEDQARLLIRQYPDSGILWKALGTSLQLQGKNGFSAIKMAAERLPNDAEAHYNLGVALQSLGQTDEAVKNYRRALKIQPNYFKAHSNLGDSLRNLGRFDDAVASYRRALEIKPDYAVAHSNLGIALKELGRFDDAVASYRRALEINPDFAEACFNLGIALKELGRIDDAVASYRRALEINPDFAEVHNNMGNAFQDLGQLDNAIACYRRALEIKPNYANAHSNLGSILMELGKLVEAEDFLSKAIELSPGEARPIAIALLYIPYRQDDPRFDQLEAIYARRGSLPLEDRIKLNFAMGKAMESIGQYDRSFSAYEEGNRLYYQGHPFDEAEAEQVLENLCPIFTANLFRKFAALSNSLPSTQDERVPIFIVGFPRSGTTLIEQVLASNPAIFGAGELTIFNDIDKKAGILLRNSTNEETALLALRKLGQEYLDQVWKLAPGARYITDKMPGNYQFLGLIHLMLPNAKIIHSMRDPIDTCFSCYALRFTHGHEYSYDLGAVGRHYLRYSKLMKHWHNVLPSGRILDVRYEDMVADPEHEARRLLDYLGLPWDPACLSFHENKRTIRTASVAQVRKPIYSSSVARWKRFEKHLEPLLEIIHQAKL